MKITDLQNYSVTSPAKKIPETTQRPETDNRILGGTQDVLNTVFGGEKIGEAIGTQIAKFTPGGRELRRQQREGEITEEQMDDTLRGPSGKEIVGDVARTGLTFAPVGRLAQGLQRGAQALGLGTKAAGIGGNIVAGGATGAAFDVAEDVAEGRDVGLGGGTLFGAGIPAASPVLGALTRATGKVLGRGGAEVTGKLTGTSAETVEQAFEAARAGGDQLEQFTRSMRGKSTPEELVNLARESAETVAITRSQIFKETLSELSDEVVSSAPAKEGFRQTLEEVGIKIKPNGILDFSGNKLRQVPNAQNKITQAWDEIRKMPDSLPISELDVTRQAVKAIKAIAGDDPSANLANMLVEDGVRSVRRAGEQVDGYGQMLDNFGETSEFLEQIQKGLSTGDKSTIDQAYRRLATTLRTNNEQRMALVRELDEATGGALLSQISGQQLSEALPRGLVGTYLAPVFVGTTAAGAVTPALLPGLLLASPRAVGEFTRSLGISAAKADALYEGIQKARDLLIKIGAIGGAEFDNSGNSTIQE